jgi:uncharacterized protein YwqG
LSFLASVNLHSVAAVLPLDWLPQNGKLLFFCDVEAQPWGFDPNDRDSWKVIYLDENAAVERSRSAAPSLPTVSVSLRRIESLPSYQRAQVTALELTDKQADELSEITNSVYGKTPCHQIGGYPNPVQGDEMELECQLAFHGIYVGDPSRYHNSRAEEARGGAKDWKLLLQVDSDNALEVMWGDAGVVYFWIRDQDARAKRFENAWLVLQCH